MVGIYHPMYKGGYKKTRKMLHYRKNGGFLDEYQRVKHKKGYKKVSKVREILQISLEKIWKVRKML